MGNVFSISLDGVFSRCLDCTIKRATYIYELQDNLASLKTELQNLIRLRDDMNVKINLAEQRLMKRKNQVEGWLQSVEDVMAEVDQLLKAESQETEKLCLGGYCSTNCKSSYKFGKQVADKLQVVDSLQKKGRDFGNDVADSVPEDLVDKLRIELQANLASLKTELQNLIRLRDDVNVKINIAEERSMKRTHQVQGWLQSVETVITEVDQLLKAESQEIEKLCLGGYCSTNSKSSYKFGKRVADKLQVVDSLQKKGRDFGNDVAERVPEDPVNKVPFEATIIGQDTIFDKVWRCIREEHGVGIIGLFGIGGVGKTTLLTQINNNFYHNQLGFDVVIWILVTKELRLEEIQEGIGKKIGLYDQQWKNKTLQAKAIDILKILSRKKFVLLLDDIWNHVDLKEVGVPNPGPDTTSKIIFTTRYEWVCAQMRATYFRVDCLGHDQAWELFRINLQGVMLDSNPNILRLAKEVVEECGGLPLVIKTIAKAMACSTTFEEWDYAREVLKSSPTKFPGMDADVYPCLKFSYDRLGDAKIKSCFKYCCLFPEDHLIFKRDLIDCWIGEGFLNESEGGVVVSQGYSIIATLIRACLLEEEENDCVKMHDVIRDMALWITSSEVETDSEIFVVCANAGLLYPRAAKTWEPATKMSLMDNKIEILPKSPQCPSLTTLFLNKNLIRTIPQDFFQYMSSLKVLDLSNNAFLRELPSGISKLILLQYLNLGRTEIKELPEELKALVNLKCLMLEESYRLHMIPRQLISKLLRLQVLRMPRCIWMQQREDSVLYGNGEVLVDELLHLEHISVLSISIKSLNALQKLLSACRKLQRCTLNLVDFDGANFAKSFDISSLAHVEYLNEISLGFDGLEELTIDCALKTVQKIQKFQGFENLHKVTINCSKVREMTWLIFAPNLKSITFFSCYKLEEVISEEKLGEVSEMIENLNPFSKLQSLSFGSVYNLKSIYWKALFFPQLKEINVSECPNLKKLPLDSNSTKERKIVIRGEENWWKELQWEDEATRNVFLPCFESSKF